MKTLPAHNTCQHRLYSLGCEEYEQLLMRASGQCEICGKQAAAEYGGKLAIDHDGRVNCRAVRGMVCRKCNAHLRRVDARERPAGAEALVYLASAWYLRNDPRTAMRIALRYA